MTQSAPFDWHLIWPTASISVLSRANEILQVWVGLKGHTPTLLTGQKNNKQQTKKTTSYVCEPPTPITDGKGKYTDKEMLDSGIWQTKLLLFYWSQVSVFHRLTKRWRVMLPLPVQSWLSWKDICCHAHFDNNSASFNYLTCKLAATANVVLRVWSWSPIADLLFTPFCFFSLSSSCRALNRRKTPRENVQLKPRRGWKTWFLMFRNDDSSSSRISSQTQTSLLMVTSCRVDWFYSSCYY